MDGQLFLHHLLKRLSFFLINLPLHLCWNYLSFHFFFHFFKILFQVHKTKQKLDVYHLYKWWFLIRWSRDISFGTWVGSFLKGLSILGKSTNLFIAPEGTTISLGRACYTHWSTWLRRTWILWEVWGIWVTFKGVTALWLMKNVS